MYYAIGQLDAVAELVNIGVEPADDANQYNACGADKESDFGISVALESGNRAFVGIDVHCLHNEKVVVERYHRVD